MAFNGEQLILGRVLRELQNARTVGLGPGMPRALIPHLKEGTRWVDPARPMSHQQPVDLAIVEALEVSERGDLALDQGVTINGFQAKRWIVVGPIESRLGLPIAVRNCRFPVQRPRCVDLIVTQLGVIEITKVGFALRELAPGASSDDVRLRIRASLHVADNLRLIRL